MPNRSEICCEISLQSYSLLLAFSYVTDVALLSFGLVCCSQFWLWCEEKVSDAYKRNLGGIRGCNVAASEEKSEFGGGMAGVVREMGMKERETGVGRVKGMEGLWVA